MLRRFVWSITLLVLAFGVVWPVIFSGRGADAEPTADPVVITHYDADFVVGADGRLQAVETITATFPGDRHGLFRFWDVVNQNDVHVRQVPEIESISLDGKSVPYQMLWEEGRRFRVAKIGDPDRPLKYGRHVFEIRYSIDGVLGPGTGAATQPGSVFYWNVIAPAWNNVIRSADISVALPGRVPDVQCSVGYGVGAPCEGLTIVGNTVRLSAESLAPRTPVTVLAGVDVPTPPRATVPWPPRWDGVLGHSLTGALCVAALTVAAGVAGLLWYRSTLERSPGFPLQYAPPDGVGPVQAEYIRTEAVPKQALTATLFHLAERGLIELRQMTNGHWRIRGQADRAAWREVDPVGLAVGSALRVTSPDEEFVANETARSGERLAKAKGDMIKAIEKWSDDKLLVKARGEMWVRVANVIALLLIPFGVFRWGFPTTMWALPFAAFFLATLGSWAAGVGTRRTEEGRELWSRAGGFHRMLTTDSAEARFDFGARNDLYSAYVPYAVAAGAAALWAKKYEADTGTAAPQPDWYHTTSATGVGFIGGGSGLAAFGGFDSFDSALSSSSGAYTASQNTVPFVAPRHFAPRRRRHVHARAHRHR
ncbi:DUF2207 domain-containing protein, partial [Mycolicibacterium celeriflavum]|uniref:DUF2207 domain-containing protein n=1 Tax=Mycolicibacterium celeriflavum TaxID=1249101 RepID=UPI003CF98D23